MGPQRLTLSAVAAVLAACGGPAAPAPVAPSARARHMQIVPAQKTAEREALIARFQERNPGWSVGDIQPFVGYVKRAASMRAPAPGAVADDVAATAARAFVRRNSDLLGVPASFVASLAAESNGPSVVALEGTYPSKGYEGFPEIENKIELVIVVDGAGEPVAVDNRSAIHARLAIDTKPELPENSARIVEQVVGRTVFALDAAGGKIPLGKVAVEDFREMRLFIHASPGPMRAWVTYRLVWIVIAAKVAPGTPYAVYFFPWVVDADTGDIVEETHVPTAPANLGP